LFFEFDSDPDSLFLFFLRSTGFLVGMVGFEVVLSSSSSAVSSVDDSLVSELSLKGAKLFQKALKY